VTSTPPPTSPSADAFDHIAARYDAEATDALISRWLRERVWAWLADMFRPGDHVLEIGCGTGEDAVWLALRGVHITATDASPQMLDLTRQKAEAAGVSALVSTRLLDLNDAATWALPPHDGAFSNYGALNCVGDWRDLGAALGRIVRPGGRVGFVVMGPFCLWETLWHGLHGDLHTATRRWRGRSVATVGGVSFPVHYPTPGRFSRDLGAAFMRQRVMGVGVALPPSDVYGVIGKRVALARLLRRVERVLAPYPPFRYAADHFWWEGTRR
jgi:SAM-dependent methyltransferase